MVQNVFYLYPKPKKVVRKRRCNPGATLLSVTSREFPVLPRLSLLDPGLSIPYEISTRNQLASASQRFSDFPGAAIMSSATLGMLSKSSHKRAFHGPSQSGDGSSVQSNLAALFFSSNPNSSLPKISLERVGK